MADCAIVLTDTSYTRVYRTQDLLGYRAIGHRKWPEGAFIPNVLSLNVPPGGLSAHGPTQRPGPQSARASTVTSSKSNRILGGIAPQRLQLGYHISDRGGDEKFKKGDIYVIPMTTRAYRKDQNAYVYYEVYNLTPNTFGETRYRITYTISSETPKRPFNLLRSSVGVLTGLFAREEETQVKVGFDQVGNDPATTGYFELSLDKVKPGYNRLTVTVEDLTSEQVSAKEILFPVRKIMAAFGPGEGLQFIEKRYKRGRPDFYPVALFFPVVQSSKLKANSKAQRRVQVVFALLPGKIGRHIA